MKFLLRRVLFHPHPAAFISHYKPWTMKLSCLLITFCITSLQLLIANAGVAQGGLDDVKVTIELRNDRLRTAFDKIEKLTEFRFAYSKAEVDLYNNINLDKDDYTVREALERILSETRLTFRQVKNKIIISKNDLVAMQSANNGMNAAPVIADGGISGKIADGKGVPVEGASVQLQEIDKGTAADANGNFSIPNVAPGKYTLRISAVGYLQVIREVTVQDGQNVELTFELKEGSNPLNEVVVTGYSRQNRRDVTGAVSTISSDVIAQTPVSDVSAILQGRVAGVTVNGQGGPGVEQVVRIRGIGTLGDNDPLYVIDGVQTKGGLNLINPNDIESMTILKDAASCALYGARGSNGVIVITTKRGKTGAPKFEYNSYIGYEVPREYPEIMSPLEFANTQWEFDNNSARPHASAIYGSGDAPVLPDIMITRKASPTFLAVSEGDPAADPSLYSLSDYRIIRANKSGTDWFDAVFGSAVTQSHQLAVSGANDKSNYAITFNYLDNKGILMNTFFKRYSVRANTEFKVTPWLRFGENMQFAYTQNNTVSNHTDQNIIAQLFSSSPLLPVYDIAGNYAGTNGAPPELGDNPVIDRINSKNAKGYNARLLGSAYVEIEPIKNLVFQSRISIDYSPYNSRLFQDTLPQVRFPVNEFKFSEYTGHGIEWRTLNKLSYEFTINDIHKINAFVAYEASQYNFRSMGASSDSLFYNFPGYQVVSPTTGVRWQVDGNQDKITYVSQFGNINYSLLDKYLFSFTLRNDGSSKFAPANKYALFPSASVGWRISDEKFMSNVGWINDLKLRGSYGASGNDNIPPGSIYNQYYTNPIYTYYDLGTLNNSAMLGFALSQIGNPFLQWEENITTNIGLDATVMDNRLIASFNWFNRTTNKLLYTPPVTAVQGDAGAPYQNIMNFTNKGIELELSYYSKGTKSFRYDINANISTYRNNVTYIDGRPETFIVGGLYARQVPLTRSMVGHPISSLYGYEYAGMIQQGDSAGHFQFTDRSGPEGKVDGVVNDFDQTFIGNPHPKFSYGFSFNAYYKNFDVNIFFQGVYGNKIFNYWRAFTEWPGRFGKGSLDTWNENNRDAKLPIHSNRDLDDDRPSTFFVEDGSFLRLKNVQVGYTFPKIKGLSKLRIYAQAFNILTITKYSGMDPEVNTSDPGSTGIDFGGNYPISMKVLFGVNLVL